MRRLIWIIVSAVLLMPTLSASAQSATCPPSLLESANSLITQARTALDNGDIATADALLFAAQQLLMPCFGGVNADVSPTAPVRPSATPSTTVSTVVPRITPTPFSPTPVSRIPTFNAVPTADTVNRVIHSFGSFDDDVRGVDFSPNGFYVLGSSFDGNLYMYDAKTFEQVRVFGGHTDWVFNADFNRDGTLVASASADDTVRVWDVASATTIQTLSEHSENVTNVAFSPDARLLVSTGQDNLIQVYDTSTWELIETLTGHSDWVWDVSFSPSGSQFVTASGDGTLIVWDAFRFDEVARLSAHEGVVIAVEWSPDGAYILSGSHDGTAILWDAFTFAPIRAYQGVDDRAIMDVAFTRDMSLVAVASFAGYVHIWELDGTPVGTYTGHDSTGVWTVQFSLDGTRFLSGADDGGLLLNSVR